MKKAILLLGLLLGLNVQMQADDQLVVEGFSISPGETEKIISVSLENENPYVGVQFELELPDGISIMKETIDNDDVYYVAGVEDRLRQKIGIKWFEHTVTANLPDNSDSYIVVVYSGDSKNIVGNSGPIVQIYLQASTDAVPGNYKVKLKNVKLSTSESEGVFPADAEFDCAILGAAAQKEDLTSLSVSLTGWAYGADPNSPVVTGNSGNSAVTYKYKEKNAADDTYSDDVPTAVGTYTVQATIAETDNYNGKVVTADFAISKADIDAAVTLEGWTVIESANEPSVTGNSGNGTVTYKYKEKNAADDTYSDDVPTAVGQYTVQATIAETDNYNGKVVTADFAISKADITPTVTLEGWTVGAAANTPNVEGNSGNGTVTYKYKEKDAADDTYSDDVPTAVGTYTVQATVAETDNYNSGVATADFEITAPAVTTYTVTWLNYDGTALETDENVESGAMPSYDSETPLRAADGKKTYCFAGWTPVIAEVTDNAIYTATYDETDETIDGITVTTAAEGDVALEINDAEAEAVKGLIPADVDEVTVTYTRELTLSGTEAEMYTVCLPYDPPTGDNLTYYTLSTVSGTTLSFNEVALPVAYTPYMVVASATSSVGITTAQSVDLSTGVTGATATGGEYELCGTLHGMGNAEAAAGGDIYILQDDGTWHKVTTDNTDAYIPPFRAYIVKQGGGGNARLRSALGGTTRIGDRVSEGTADDWYDLQGRKMTGFDKQKSLHRLPKGVYVRKEQKIIIP